MAVYRHMRPEVIFGEWFEIDGGNGITFFIFGFAAQKDLCGKFQAGKKGHVSPIF